MPMLSEAQARRLLGQLWDDAGGRGWKSWLPWSPSAAVAEAADAEPHRPPVRSFQSQDSRPE